MYQLFDNYLRRFSVRGDLVSHRSPSVMQRQQQRRASYLASLLLLTLVAQPMLAQQKPAEPLKGNNNARSSAMSQAQQQLPTTPGKRALTVADAVTIFLQQNLQLVAARYDVDLADAEKLTARLRPNPQLTVGSSDLPLDFTGNLIKQQTYSYGISETFELGGKRSKRIAEANANSEVARAEFQTVVWQLTNDLKKKFYAVILAESLLRLTKDNQKTFEEVLKHTTELNQFGEISGLDLRRLEVEKLKFDTDVANSERDYELAVRDLRFALGGDYRATEIEATGTFDYQPYQFSLDDLRDKSLAARPDLKAAKVSELAADATIRLQDAQRIPDLNLGAGISQAPLGTNSLFFSAGINLPWFDRNQGERAKARIQKQKAQTQQQFLANQVLSDVDKALVAFNIQKRRVELYRSGVLAKVDEIQNLTEYSLKAGESSILELLDAMRTRRETLAGYYQTLFDYQMALLDLELATATPLQSK